MTTSDVCTCRGARDDQTGRCLSCGRLSTVATAPPRPIAARERPSPSRAYRAAVEVASLATEPLRPLADVPVLAALGPEPTPIDRDAYRALYLDAPPPEVVDDRYRFGSATLKRYCPCGGIVVCFVDAPIPERCAFCGFTPLFEARP